MLHYTSTFSSFSTDDIEKAHEFYSETLGLNVIKDEMGILTLHLADGARAIIYPKGENHQPATFTVLNFEVDNIEASVDQLIDAGIVFEQYTGKLQTDEKGIFRGEGPLIAWCKDNAGNILSIIEADDT
ncbi:VOC family protein [Rhodohalobacter sp. 614A]|uniref:VOC family protein n=1 Tax=Rhodohalobacter sp. 614A TaxID=2908649 RepID=UPI001F482C65|nr:VOC family protein [Rhodohalobacter sp. 614A]